MLAGTQLRLPRSRRRWRIGSALTYYQQFVEYYSSTITRAEASNDAYFVGNTATLPQAHRLAHLRSRLTSRPHAVINDCLTHIPTTLLHKTLFDFLPRHYHDVLFKRRANTSAVPPGYHLIHFPPSDPLSALQSDGTDPAHSPGPPFNRRMWAGGFMHLYRDLPFDCRNWECVEKIANVEVKGKEGEEKVFVMLKRLIVDELSSPVIVEGRTLVFMRDRLIDALASKPRVVKPPADPQYSHELTPTAGLLFRFSALSFNAHRIHLDKQYCKEVEGHRNLLVHGPLSLILMLDMLQGYLGTSSERIVRVEYKNLAPLYAEEPMTVRGKEKRPGAYEVWIEGAEGGLAVKGAVHTEQANKVSGKT